MTSKSGGLVELERFVRDTQLFDRSTEDIYNGIDGKVARKTLPSDLWAVAIRELDQLNAAIKREALRNRRAIGWRRWRRDRKGQHAIRVNDQYRVCFVWTTEGPTRVEMTDYH